MVHQRFVVWEFLKDDAYAQFWKSDNFGFVNFAVDGYGDFILGNEKSGSFRFNPSRVFEHIDVTKVTGNKTMRTIHFCRLVVAHLELLNALVAPPKKPAYEPGEVSLIESFVLR